MRKPDHPVALVRGWMVTLFSLGVADSAGFTGPATSPPLASFSERTPSIKSRDFFRSAKAALKSSWLMVSPLEKASLNLSAAALAAWILSADALRVRSWSAINSNSAFSPQTPFLPSVVLV